MAPDPIETSPNNLHGGGWTDAMMDKIDALSAEGVVLGEGCLLTDSGDWRAYGDAAYKLATIKSVLYLS